MRLLIPRTEDEVVDYLDFVMCLLDAADEVGLWGHLTRNQVWRWAESVAERRFP